MGYSHEEFVGQQLEILLPQRFRSNAFKFTPHEGQIMVHIKPTEEDMFLVEVTDSAIGISPEDIGRLFSVYRLVPNKLPAIIAVFGMPLYTG